MPPAARTQTLPSLNAGDPFVVVRLDAGRLGVVDDDTRRVWVEEAYVPEHVGNRHKLPHVALPSFPEHYGAWQRKSIGGLSKTMRRVGALRGAPKTAGLVTFFAVRAPSATAVADALRDSEVATAGDPEWDADYGHVTEVVVHDVGDLEHAAAVVARAGATPVLEDAKVNARRALGIERLDRIESSATSVEEEGEHELYGPRRGNDNWRFPWLPDGWRVPITWDHMIANVRDVRDVTALSQPLRQHVVRARLETCEDAATRAAIARHAPTKRFVSASLSYAQAKQLIEAFYLLTVERVRDPEVVHALSLVLYRYMVERGYTARWTGKYEQDAKYVGNGKLFRAFARLSQYDPHRLPAPVLNKLLGRDGRLRGRGSKGSRSKYVIDKTKRYRPKRRLVRTVDDEERMAAPLA